MTTAAQTGNIFQAQNGILRSINILLGCLGAMLLPLDTLLILIAISLLNLLFDHHAMQQLGFGIRKLLIFITAYWVMAVLFGQDYPQTVLFSLRLIALLIQTVYLIEGFDARIIMARNAFIRRSEWMRMILFYFVATFAFIEMIQRNSKTALESRKNDPRQPGFVESIFKVWEAARQQTGQVQVATAAGLETETAEHPVFLSTPNLLATAYLALLLFCFSL